ncbi:MAG: phosphodiester glycosidase family protein [Oscillospiraceae bacterium]|nr:phosphodiester glycosidase family protein [Oscillospiraceae bacterium]
MAKKTTPAGVLQSVGRVLLVILITVLLLALFVAAVLGVVIHGPSSDARRLMVLSLNETSALKFVPHLFLSNAKVEAILHPSDDAANGGDAGEPFVELGFEPGSTQAATQAETQEPGQVVVSVDPILTGNGQVVEVQAIKGSTFKGKLMIIRDPSKVIVGTLDNYGAAYHGLYLYRRPGDAEDGFIEKYDALGGTNAGGFYDPGGYGNGGTPDGLVIRNGAIAWGSPGTWYINVIGFDANHILHVGDMSGQDALNLGMTSAVSFSPGPVLVKDGVMRTGLGGGLNPRTCIGQTADGTILLMVLEGRKPDSMGATYDDIAQLMYNYGAVNAANLDGGSSSLMYYNGEQITRGSNLIGMRQMSTAILVLK